MIAPNDSGKTAALRALCRLFAFDPSPRRIQRSDFHVPSDEEVIPEERPLCIEADSFFPELANDEDNTTVVPHFCHVRLRSALVWVKVWVKDYIFYAALLLRALQALKSRLVAGFSGTGLVYFW
ncbi:hypothetical protein [Pseudomonas sp. WC2]|uniref:hypothetical protein n=1 Tax=Pseudomonas sp. WC2 TaxID=3424773 RepID=UPI003D3333C4